jgi:hypothetical protein
MYTQFVHNFIVKKITILMYRKSHFVYMMRKIQRTLNILNFHNVIYRQLLPDNISVC